MPQFFRDWIMFSLTALPMLLTCAAAFWRDERMKRIPTALCGLFLAALCGAAASFCVEPLPPAAPAVFALMLAPCGFLFRLVLGRGRAGLRMCCFAGALCSICVLVISRAAAELAAGAPESGYFSAWYPAFAVPVGGVGVFVFTLSAGRLRKLVTPGAAERWNAAALMTMCLLALLAEYSGFVYGRIAAAVICSAACWAGCAAMERRSAVRAEAEQKREAELEQLIELQRRRYAELENEISAARQARHDLRFHMAAIKRFVESGEREKIEEYLAQYGGWQDGDGDSWCGNLALDSVARHYLGRAREEGVKLDAVIKIGEEPGIPAPDLCVVLGNVLENALEAVGQVPPEKRFIRVRAEETPGWVTIVVGNAYSGRPLQYEGGGYGSSKKKGRTGMGLGSIKNVAEKYGGTARFEAGDEMFMTSVILLRQPGEE